MPVRGGRIGKEELKTPKTRKKSNDKKISLKMFASSIALAALNAKVMTDEEAVKVRKEIYEKNDIMRNFPITTFDISEIEVELKFAVEGVEKNDILITIDPEKLSSLQNALSTVKFKLTSKPLIEYRLISGEKIIKD